MYDSNEALNIMLQSVVNDPEFGQPAARCRSLFH